MNLHLFNPSLPQPWFLKSSWCLRCWRGLSSLHLAKIPHGNRFNFCLIQTQINLVFEKTIGFVIFLPKHIFQVPTENVFRRLFNLATLSFLSQHRWFHLNAWWRWKFWITKRICRERYLPLIGCYWICKSWLWLWLPVNCGAISTQSLHFLGLDCW